MLKEISDLKLKQAQEDAQRMVEEMEKEVAKKALIERKRLEQQRKEEKERQARIEQEKKRLWDQEMEKQRLQVEQERQRRIEEDRRIAADILRRRQEEEEEIKKAKQIAEDEKLRQIEGENKKALEEKKKKLFEKQTTKESPTVFVKPKKKLIDNPLAKKFEEISKTAEMEERMRKQLTDKKQQIKEKSKNLLKKSKQNIFNQNGSKSSLLKQSIEKLKKSRDCIRRSKTCLINNNKTCENKSAVSKKDMQTYLISQVLFDDDKEEVSTSRLKIKEKENKEKEIEMLRREAEVKKKIEEELRKIKMIEEENKIRQQEAHFESYKKEMEKYLDFVCEDKPPAAKTRPKKPKRKATIEGKKIALNISDIKNQFEDSHKRPEVMTTSPTVSKLDPNKFLASNQNKEQQKKKEYIPVIIDKAAFERTVGVFEKERLEEEMRRKEEENRKKRREEMIREKERLIEEKKKRLREEEEKQAILQEMRQNEDKEAIDEESNSSCAQDDEDVKSSDDEAIENEEEKKIKDIREQIRLELEKIEQEEAKQREKIIKENKKKELMRQIQEEIDKISSSQSPTQEDTPKWIKMIMNKNKEEEKNTQVLSCNETQDFDNLEPEPEIEEPKWIKVFKEKSKRLENMTIQKNNEGDHPKKAKIKELTKEKQNKVEQIHDCKPPKEENSQCNGKDGKLAKKIHKQEEKADAKDNVAVRHKSINDRVRKVKSLILDSGPKVEKKEKIKVEKDKASKIKSFFESKPTQKEVKVKHPKKKIVQVPITEVYSTPQTKPEKEWKWKSKNSSELYEFINNNKKFIPEELTKQAERMNIRNNEKEKKEDSVEMSEDNFDKYIEDLQTYLDEEDNNESETIFKETILAYLDLIDKEPCTTNKKQEKKLANFEPGRLMQKIELLENEKYSEYPIKQQQVGKVDTSFLNKAELVAPNQKLISTDNCSNMKNRYEKLSTDEEPKPLFAMKRKPFSKAEQTVDPLSLTEIKKRQTAHQWKYKQKDITELHKFIESSGGSEKIQNNTELTPYVSCLPKIDVESRLQDEEKRMEEFENFMDGIHSYLEMETVDYAESDFKWQIQSYLDLIEDNSEPAPKPVPLNKLESGFSDAQPSTKKILQQLKECNTVKEKSSDIKVGKIDASSFLNQQRNNENKSEKPITAIKKNAASRIIEAFETTKEDVHQEMEKTVVKKKIVNLSCERTEDIKPVKIQQDWKYKQKTLLELNSFIKTNQDLVANSERKERLCTGLLSSTDLNEKTKKLHQNLRNKEEEFEEFMKELEDLSLTESSNEKENLFKEELKGYLELIETRTRKDQKALPELRSPKKISEMHEQLWASNNKSSQKPKNGSAIGKVSTFFKKSTKESCNNAKIMKENIESLLQPGKTKFLKGNFESKPKLQRSVSAMEINPGKLNMRDYFPASPHQEELPINRKEIVQFKYKQPKPVVDVKSMPVQRTERDKQQQPKTKKIESVWSNITDPEERKNAILAKYGFKPAKVETEDDSDIEDYLNYENGAEIADYEAKLKEQYALEDDSESRESTPEKDNNKTGSLSSLLNILKTMRQSKTTKTFNDSKSKVLSFNDTASSKFSKSDVDLSEISKSCTDMKGLFESGKANGAERRHSTAMDDPTLKEAKAKKKKSDWEGNLKEKFSCKKAKERVADTELPSVKDFKSMFDSGRLNSEVVHEYIEGRSVTSRQLSEEDFDGSQPVQSELEALRSSAKMKMFSKIEKGSRGASSSSHLDAGLR